MSWFKNLQIYRLPRRYAMTAIALAEYLAPQAFTPPSANEEARAGWIPPIEGGALVHDVQGQFLMRLRTEKRLLPSSVVNEVAKARAAELEEQQGFPPGKKAMKELKERVTDELLPRAFPIPSFLNVWMDPANGWLVIDTPTASKADDALKLLLKAIPTFPVESLRVSRSPVAVMTGWLESDEAPAGFTIDQDAELRATGESRAAVKFVKHSLDPSDVARHIAAGKQATRLALTFDSRVSFIVRDTLAILRVAPLDVIKEGAAVTYNDVERFDADFFLMAAELNRLIAALVEAFGGEADEGQADLVKQQNQAPADPAQPAAWPGKTGATKKRGPTQIDIFQGAKHTRLDLSNLPIIDVKRVDQQPPAEGWRRIFRRDCTFCAGGREEGRGKCAHCQGSGVRESADWYSPEDAEALIASGKGQPVAGK